MPSPRKSPRRSSRSRKQTSQGSQFRQEKAVAKQRRDDKSARDEMIRLFDRANMGTAPSRIKIDDDLSSLFGKTAISKPTRKHRTGPKKKKGKTKKGKSKGRARTKKRKHGKRRRSSPERGTRTLAAKRRDQLRKDKYDTTLRQKRARIPMAVPTFQF